VDSAGKKLRPYIKSSSKVSRKRKSAEIWDVASLSSLDELQMAPGVPMDAQLFLTTAREFISSIMAGTLSSIW